MAKPHPPKKTKLYLGVLLGLAYALTFYSLLYMSRESLRLFSIRDNYSLWILTEEETQFYNLFFAFLSILIGQSIAIQFWADRRRKLLTNARERLTTIINDQRALMWCFLSWFSKLATSFVFIFIVALEGDVVFNFYDAYKYVYVLFILVLFLQSWVTIRRVHKRKSLQWMGISFLIISVLSFGLSKVNLIDYQEFNQRILNQNICHKYNLEVPQISYANKNETSDYLIQKIYFARNDSTKQPLLFWGNVLINFDKLGDSIERRNESIRSYGIRRVIKYQLYIDKDIPMKFVQELTAEFSKATVFKIAFSALPSEPAYRLSHYRNYSITHRLPIQLPEFNHKDYPSDNYININIVNENEILIDNVSSTPDSLKSNILNRMLPEQGNEIILQFSDSCTFESYLQILSLATEALHQIRNEYSIDKYEIGFDYLLMMEKKNVRTKYQLWIVDSMLVKD